MLHLSLSDPGAPSLSDLLRNVPVFADLPEEGIDCLRHLRNATAEEYEAGEWADLGQDMLVLCSGSIEIIACLPDERRARFSAPAVVLRFDHDAMKELSSRCPAIWRSFGLASAKA